MFNLPRATVWVKKDRRTKGGIVGREWEKGRAEEQKGKRTEGQKNRRSEEQKNRRSEGQKGRNEGTRVHA
jgi:hypothetical protein